MGMLVDVLTFEGCPHAARAVALARRAIDEAGVSANVRVVHVTAEETRQRRFLGSPSIRVDGRDVESGAELRIDFTRSCRLYATSAGLSPLPDQAWLRQALVAGR
jgi:hypothetical protein